MYGSNFNGGYGAYQQQPQQYQSPAAQRAYQQIGSPAPFGQQPQYTAPAQIGNPGFTWVQGDAAARSFMVAPGATVLLMDSDANRFYIKSADQSGMPTMRMFEYTELDPNATRQQPAQDMTTQYVTRDEYNALANSYQELAEKINRLLNNDTKRRKAVPDNEESSV